MYDNFEDIKIGDKFCVYYGFSNQIHIQEVKKVTPKYFGDNTMYDKRTGKMRGRSSGFNITYAYKLTPERIKIYNIQVLQIKIAKLASVANKIKIDENNYSKINNIINELLAMVEK